MIDPADGRRPIRVLMVCHRFLPELGGIETHVDQVARRIDAMPGFDVTVLTSDRSRSLPREEQMDGLRVLRVPSWPRARDYYFAPGIGRVVGDSSAWDVVHAQGVHTPVPPSTMYAALRAKIPYVSTFHTGGHSVAYRNAVRSVQWRILGPLLRRADALVGVSTFEADLLTEQAHLRPGSVQVIRNGGTLPSPSPGLRPVPGRIVSSGRLERYKGHHRAIEALPAIRARVSEAHLVILGSGPYHDELIALADHVGVAEQVTVKHLPPADRVAMADELAQAQVLAALSDYEAHPVAVMEALSVGTVVVGFDIAGIGDLVAEGWVTGVPPAAGSSQIAAAITAAMGSPSPVRPEELPTWDSCAEALAQVYRSVAAPGLLGDRPVARARLQPAERPGDEAGSPS